MIRLAAWLLGALTVRVCASKVETHQGSHVDAATSEGKAAQLSRIRLTELIGTDVDQLIRDELVLAQSKPGYETAGSHARHAAGSHARHAARREAHRRHLKKESSRDAGITQELESEYTGADPAGQVVEELSSTRYLALLAVVGVFYCIGLRWDVAEHAGAKSSLDEHLQDQGIAEKGVMAEMTEARHNKLPKIWPMFTRLWTTTEHILPDANALSGGVWFTNLLSSTGVPEVGVRMSTGKEGGGRLLEAESTGAVPMLLASICATTLEYRGLGGKVIGKLQREGPGRLALVSVEGKELIKLGVEGDAVEMKMPDGVLVGSLRAHPQSAQRLLLTVQPGVDVVFVTLAALASKCFGASLTS